MPKSPLSLALARGMEPGGDLAEELRELGDYPIRTKQDAQAICEALRKLPMDDPEDNALGSPALYALTSLFQEVEGRDAPAFDVLNQEGLPELIRIFDASIEQGDLLFILKILAMYGSREGAEKVVEAAKRPFNTDAYMWGVVLSMFSEGHPHRKYVFAELSDPLPSGFLAIALLDSANSAAIEDDLEQHPFDSPTGWKQLQSWLEDSNPDYTSYAHSATAALPFIRNPARDQLLALAMDHRDTGVQMVAAWAAGKLGREAGLKILARYCLDVNQSNVAQRYLAELDREDLIPEEAREASFQAKAEFANWLAHPNELGRPPDELEIVDHRELTWPPDGERRPFWVIKYRLRDETGLEDDDVDCGLVGSMTWCFFTYNMQQRPPEDVYAIHCMWELGHEELIEESEVTDASEYAELLKQWQGPALEDVTITLVAEISPRLKTSSRLVALASAKKDGQEGWVVLDGPRSAWYPKDEQPEDSYESVILKIHIGRQLLGFPDEPNRKKYLVAAKPTRTPEQIIAAYEKLLNELPKADADRQEDLLGSGPLGRHFAAYVDALAEVKKTPEPDHVIRVYGRFLELAANADESIREEIHDSFSVLGNNFDEYVDALVANGRTEDVLAAIKTFEPHWDHNMGYGKLGTAAYKAGKRDIAEPYLLKLREGLENYFRSEKMGMLAEIWHDRGEDAKARELLVDCLRKLVPEIKDAEHESDQKMFVEDFHHHRATYLRLFPEGEKELADLGIPEDPQN